MEDKQKQALAYAMVTALCLVAYGADAIEEYAEEHKKGETNGSRED